MKVELLKCFGDDSMVCEAARVSYDKLASNYSLEQNEKLIKYLARHGHWSPFSHPKLQFRVEMPIYVERQIVKSEAGREYNSISGRYVDFSDTYTLIEGWRKQSLNSKQGSEGFVENQDECNSIQMNVIEFCKNAYNKLISLGVSKEQARTVLPLSLNTSAIFTVSFYWLIRLCNQRLAKDAQVETGNVVREMLRLVRETNLFNNSLNSFNY